MGYIQPRNWGHIEFLGYRRDPIMLNGPKGPYVADTHGPVMLLMRCACGHEFEMDETLFPGRRKLTYCQRPECPHAPKPERVRGPAEPSQIYTVYLPQWLGDQMRQWAKDHHTSLSGAARAIWQKGLVADMLDSE